MLVEQILFILTWYMKKNLRHKGLKQLAHVLRAEGARPAQAFWLCIQSSLQCPVVMCEGLVCSS